MKLEIFDPALCCPTGVCGPDVDPELTRIASDLHVLKNHGAEVIRYNLTQDPEPFVQNKQVNELMKEKGMDVLPVTLLDGEIMKSGDYPNRYELTQWLKLEEDVLKKGTAPRRVDIEIK
ncbi:arsenite efflux transporter metallochaperone ArsD [Alteribacillus sp. HJP-4]|uniref:arsenite efflux transporter metallochaperone ArsD n=1 Tax=Alteribacillus sp. HJP-4 TaxID=2775394 RepID=UPI0035CD21DA